MEARKQNKWTKLGLIIIGYLWPNVCFRAKREHLFRYSTKLGLSAQRLLPANTAASHRSLLLVTFRVHSRSGWRGGSNEKCLYSKVTTFKEQVPRRLLELYLNLFSLSFFSCSSTSSSFPRNSLRICWTPSSRLWALPVDFWYSFAMI